MRHMWKIALWLVAGLIMFAPISNWNTAVLSATLGCVIMSMRQSRIAQDVIDNRVVQMYADTAYDVADLMKVVK